MPMWPQGGQRLPRATSPNPHDLATRHPVLLLRHSSDRLACGLKADIVLPGDGDLRWYLDYGLRRSLAGDSWLVPAGHGPSIHLMRHGPFLTEHAPYSDEWNRNAGLERATAHLNAHPAAHSGHNRFRSGPANPAPVAPAGPPRSASPQRWRSLARPRSPGAGMMIPCTRVRAPSASVVRVASTSCAAAGAAASSRSAALRRRIPSARARRNGCATASPSGRNRRRRDRCAPASQHPPSP